MKHIPILFSTDMVQAEREGRKTQTRRTKGLEKINDRPDDWELTQKQRHLARFYKDDSPNPIKTFFIFRNKITKEEILLDCPYGTVRDQENKSDVLWVRESFLDATLLPNWIHNRFHKMMPRFLYKADITMCDDYTWKPSIHMPKTACRTWFQLVSVKPERLQDISEDDAIAEGVQKLSYGGGSYKNYCAKPRKDGGVSILQHAATSFFSLWDSINGDGSWLANPWVWRIEFKRIEKPENFI